MLASLALTLAALAGPAESTYTIRGRVTNVRTGEPIEDALVLAQCVCLKGSRESRTNALGLYAFHNLPPGRYTLQFFAGYADMVKIVRVGDATRVAPAGPPGDRAPAP